MKKNRLYVTKRTSIFKGYTWNTLQKQKLRLSGPTLSQLDRVGLTPRKISLIHFPVCIDRNCAGVETERGVQRCVIGKSYNLGSQGTTGSISCSKGPTGCWHSGKPLERAPCVRALEYSALMPVSSLILPSWNVSGNFSHKSITDAQWENLTYTFRT